MAMEKQKHKRGRGFRRGLSVLVSAVLALTAAAPLGLADTRRAEAAGAVTLHDPTTDSNGVTTWDCVYFGDYWQNDTNGDGTADQDDEKEPIKWRVLSVDGDDAFLLADVSLDTKPYNTLHEEDRVVTWERCTLRSWLNGYGSSSNVEGINYSSDNFLDAAFSEAEQAAINTVGGMEGGNDTNDKVYLLSTSEVSNASYGFHSDPEADSDTRIAVTSAYASYLGVSMVNVWWLRSPGMSYVTSLFVTGVDTYGKLNSSMYACYENRPVRPALHLDLSSYDLYSYAGTVSSNGESVEMPAPTALPDPDGGTDIPATSQPDDTELRTLEPTEPAGDQETSMPHGTAVPGGDAGILQDPTTDEDGVTTWDCVYFGNYWQNDTNKDGKVNQQDEKEPIKWRVLSVDGDDAFLLADAGLDRKPYNTSWTGVTWETCTLRSWLNGYGSDSNTYGTDYRDGNFLDDAFSGAEQAAISTVTVVNEDNSYHDMEGGNDTNDKVYLLSIGEASNASYGFHSDYIADSDTRIEVNSAYAMAQGAYTDIEGAGWWWLRSPGYNRVSAAYVDADGRGDYYGDVNLGDRAVRPALHLDLSSYDLYSYAGTVSSNGKSVEMPAPTALPDPDGGTDIPATSQPTGTVTPTISQPTGNASMGGSLDAAASASPDQTPAPGGDIPATSQPIGPARPTPSPDQSGIPATSRPQPTGAVTPTSSPTGSGVPATSQPQPTGAVTPTLTPQPTAPGSGIQNTTTPAPARVSVKKPSKVKSLKVEPGRKKLTLTWKKVSGASGYQVQVSQKKNFKNAAKMRMSGSKRKYVAKGLKARKRYYVRVRAYKIHTDPDGMERGSYGSWSKRIAVRTR